MGKSPGIQELEKSRNACEDSIKMNCRESG
jgi:hypothetical protein